MILNFTYIGFVCIRESSFWDLQLATTVDATYLVREARAEERKEDKCTQYNVPCHDAHIQAAYTHRR